MGIWYFTDLVLCLATNVYFEVAVSIQTLHLIKKLQKAYWMKYDTIKYLHIVTTINSILNDLSHSCHLHQIKFKKKNQKLKKKIKMNLKLLFFIFLILVTVQQCLTDEGKDKNPAQKKVLTFKLLNERGSEKKSK